MIDLNAIVLKYYSKLNETDLLIWEYIARHKKEVSSLTITELAEATNVSRTTISRFVRKLGLTGYSEFKVLLNMSNETLPQSREAFHEACDCLSNYINKQRDKDFGKVCQLIFDAKRVFVYGTGDVQQSVAKQFKRLFLSVEEVVYDFAGTTFDPAMYNILDSNDLIFIISLSGNTDKVLSIARQLKMTGTKIISLTEFKNNPLAELSDENLYIDTTKLSFLATHPNYKMTIPYYLLVELLFIQYAMYKNNRLVLSESK
ncbi:MurR/RpiR family transcriptional regulator [Streptococcus sp. S784/96/1]|uniref:MurR/RpiR family transcriptional regulator n=1 Tax=Streptococcus sp. S784/96/1 TaxID=2653499 RepID=UPI00138A6A5E|nr:MurR/RpiR family transcriptional regulator [Streptococcus sp. S784/96/1]